jgi:hypothetical protein
VQRKMCRHDLQHIIHLHISQAFSQCRSNNPHRSGVVIHIQSSPCRPRILYLPQDITLHQQDGPGQHLPIVARVLVPPIRRTVSQVSRRIPLRLDPRLPAITNHRTYHQLLPPLRCKCHSKVSLHRPRLPPASPLLPDSAQSQLNLSPDPFPQES